MPTSHSPWKSASTRAITFASDETGSVFVEYTFIFPLLILLTFGIIDAGRILLSVNMLTFAVEQAARCAVINTKSCDTDAKVKTFAAAQANVLGVKDSSFTVATPSCGKQVSTSYSVKPIVAALVPATFNIRISSCYPKAT